MIWVRVLLRDEQGMFPRGFWCVKGLFFVLQYVAPGSSAGWSGNGLFFVIVLIGILGFVVIDGFLYSIPKGSSWARLSRRTSLGESVPNAAALFFRHYLSVT